MERLDPRQRDRLRERRFCGIAAAVIGGLGAVAGATISNKGVKSAANSQAQAANATAAQAAATNTENNQLIRDIRADNLDLLNPFVTRGNAAGDTLADTSKTNPFLIDPNDYVKSPYYDLRIKQGNEAINTNLAAQGLLRSGKLLKDVTRFGQEEGLRDYSDWYGRTQGEKQAFINLLMDRERTGLSGASAVAGVNQNFGGQVTSNNNAFLNTIANTNSQRADATSNAALAGAANTNNLIGSLAGAYGQYAGMSSFGRPNPFMGPAGGTPPPAPPITGWSPPSGGPPLPALY